MILIVDKLKLFSAFNMSALKLIKDNMAPFTLKRHLDG